MPTPTQLCPCGSQKELANCCQPIHQVPTRAQHPEQLMRARYSAHVLGLVDFVVATYHPSCEAEQYREAIADSVHSQWLGLEVISSEIADNGEGFVEFKAYYQDGEEEFCLHERSRFLREPAGNEMQWYYIDGEYPHQPNEVPEATVSVSTVPAVSDKVGRNDPCPCGSGKKYKKCCG
ncbi:SEC-C domain-containing protein [Photobacterium sp. SDRW27]|uniref:YchJ family metal-binding protein n=1 Tax=Photobacterium obscurum TaxID=2829490 RepID=UPI0022434051|nr:YchJ family metal-binding protein [Photobacterium obscurum]MCW8327516.1 SEC-C domain-containing protein [Photobacterium obscurum]